MIVVRPRREEDDQQIVAISNAVYPDMEITVERYRHHLATTQRNPSGYVERHVAEDAGRIVGTMTLERQPWLGRPGSFYAEILVDPNVWGRGIGSRLNATLDTRARSVGAARVYALIQEGNDRAQRVAEAHGYRSTGRVDRMSRLPVAHVNLDGYAGIEERLAGENIRVRSIAELSIDDDFLRAVQEMEVGTERDVPSVEEDGEPLPFELWKEDKLFAPGRSLETFWVALHGDRPIGVARLAERSKTTLYNGYTGVDRAYRGRGVARLLKLKTVQWAQRKGYTWIYTGNDVENTRMLSINVRLGYEPRPGMVLVVKEMGEGSSD